MRARTVLAAIVAGLALWVFTTPAVRARKVVAVAATCPAGELHIDHDGKKDACIATARPSCSPGATLAIDAMGDRDACRRDDSTAKPKCPQGHTLKVGPGEDACQWPQRPQCRKGYELRVKEGEDHCVY